MNLAGRTLVIKGEVTCTTDLALDGHVEGPIWTDGHTVTIAPTAVVKGDVVAARIVVQGAVTGDLLATASVQMTATAKVQGRVLSPRMSLAEGGTFNGRVEPQQVEAALTVAKHRHQP